MRIKSLAQLQALIQNPDGLLVDHRASMASELMRIAKRVQESLRESLNEEFQLKWDDQDRSDFAQIAVPSFMLKHREPYPVEIRLSSQVPLVAINDEHRIHAPWLEKIKDALLEAGCIVADQQIFLAADPAWVDSNSSPLLADLWYSLFDYD